MDKYNRKTRQVNITDGVQNSKTMSEIITPIRPQRSIGALKQVQYS